MLGRHLQHRGGGSGLGNLTMHSMPHSLIKSIQQGTITMAAATSGTLTLSPAMDPNNSIILQHGHQSSSGTISADVQAQRLTFTNSTTITANRGLGTGTSIVGVTVIEFWPGIIRRVERGTITLADTASSGSATLASTIQNLNKAWLISLGYSTPSGNTSPNNWASKIVLTDASTVTASRSNTVGAHTHAYQVVEFY